MRRLQRARDHRDGDERGDLAAIGRGAKTRTRLAGLLLLALLATGLSVPAATGAAATPDDVGQAWFTDGAQVWVLDIATGQIDAPDAVQLPDVPMPPGFDGQGEPRSEWLAPRLTDVSDNGRWLLFSSGIDVFVLDAQTGQVQTVLELSASEAASTGVGWAGFRGGTADEVVLSLVEWSQDFDADGQPGRDEVTIQVRGRDGVVTQEPSLPDVGVQLDWNGKVSPDGRYVALGLGLDTSDRLLEGNEGLRETRVLILDLQTGSNTITAAPEAASGTLVQQKVLEWLGDSRLVLEENIVSSSDPWLRRITVVHATTGAATATHDPIASDLNLTYGVDPANIQTRRTRDGQQLSILQDISRRVEAIGIVGLDGQVWEYPVDELLAFNDGEPPVRFRLGLVAWTPPAAIVHGDGTGVSDATNAHRDAIGTALADGLLTSCAPFRFCSGEPTTRRSMALALSAALDHPDPGTDGLGFADVPEGDPAAGAIRALVDAGITQGCGDGTVYCPDDPVSRAQMASFFTRAYDLPAGPLDRFDDVAPTSVHAPGIAAVAAAGITIGCGDGSGFCPSDSIRRDQMATFLDRRP